MEQQQRLAAQGWPPQRRTCQQMDCQSTAADHQMLCWPTHIRNLIYFRQFNLTVMECKNLSHECEMKKVQKNEKNPFLIDEIENSMIIL